MKEQRALIAAIVALVVVRIACAWTMPIVPDEAYYLQWGRFPDWGYFDHPPMVAWLAWISTKFSGTTPLMQRSGALVLGILSVPLALRLAAQFAPQRRRLTAVMILGSLYALGSSFLITPDVAMTFFWMLALHEAAVAFGSDERRWVTAGIATGLAITAKYIAVLIGPVFLLALLRKKGGLKRPWPYAGGLACVITLLPHLVWSAQNNFVTIRYQAGHGLLGRHDTGGSEAGRVPKAVAPPQNTAEYRLGAYFFKPEDLPKPHPEKTPWQKLRRRMSDYGGAAVGMWGALGIVMIWSLLQRRGRLTETVTTPIRTLAAAAACVPLIGFAIVALFQSIEANWPAVYLIGAALWLAPWIHRARGIAVAAVANAAIIAVAAWHGGHPFSVKRPGEDRVLTETHGYGDAAAVVRALDGPVFAETYQLASMLMLHAGRGISQFPGLTRPSEMTRRDTMRATGIESLPSFWLIHGGILPPLISGFRANSLSEFRDCLSGFYRSEAFADARYEPPCADVVHRWFLVHYERSDFEPEI